MMNLLSSWALNMVVASMSMDGQKALEFHKKYLNLCSEDKTKVLRVWNEMKAS